MDLEKLNQDYSKLKASKAAYSSSAWKVAIKAAQIEVTSLNRRLDMLVVDEKYATTKDEKTAVAEKIAIVKSELEVKKQELEKMRADVANSEKAVDDKINELRKNPELRTHIDEVIQKRAERKIKNELEPRKDALETLKQLAVSNPDVDLCFRNIEKYNRDLSNLQAKNIAPGDRDNAKIEELKLKISSTRAEIARLCKGQVSREVIDSVSSVKDMDRQINGLDKSIQDYSSLATKNISRNDEPENGFDDEPTTWERFKDWFKQTKLGKWIDSKRTPRLSSPEVEPLEFDIDDCEEKEGPQDFKDSLKYEVVKDYVDVIEKEELQAAKAERKGNEKDTNPDIDEER